jgi:Protein of unknown function (DUF2971)
MTPPHLYKYKSLKKGKDRKYTLRVLTNNEIYLAVFDEFNDPLDCHLRIEATAERDVARRELRKLNPEMTDTELEDLVTKELSPEMIKQNESKMLSDVEVINRKVGIFCMSARPDDLLMWSHYGDGHRGVCLEFATSDERLFGCTIEHVRYRKQYPVFNAYEGAGLEFVRRYLTTKSDVWSYEEEWRILHQDHHGPQEFPGNELSGVILGAKISPRDRTTVLNILKKRSLAARSMRLE